MSERAKQMTLGELIDALKRRPSQDTMRFDFGRFVPDGVASYRGYYDQLAIGFTEYRAVPVADLLAQLEAAVGGVFEGYKGGSFRMDRDTPIWVSNYGESHDTAVVDVIGTDYGVTVIATGFVEY